LQRIVHDSPLGVELRYEPIRGGVLAGRGLRAVR
jgi:hypothetical protein